MLRLEGPGMGYGYNMADFTKSKQALVYPVAKYKSRVGMVQWTWQNATARDPYLVLE